MKENKKEPLPAKGKANKKKLSKAIGLKNTLVFDDTAYLISMGAGNSGDIEKRIKDREIKNIKNTFRANFADDKGNTVLVYKNPKEKSAVNVPDLKKPNQLHAKSAVENMVFGKSFNDNLHIQIAYNILDIRKQLNYYSNFVVNSIDSWFMRNATEEEFERGHDFVGMFNGYIDFSKAALAYNIVSTGLIDPKKSKTDYYYDIKKLRDRKNADKYKLIFDNVKHSRNQEINLQSVTYFLKNVCGWKQYKFIETAALNFKRCSDLIDSSVYFSDCFVDNKSNFDPKKCYDLISLMEDVRNKVFHTSCIEDSTWIFQNEVAASKSSTLNKLFDDRLSGINDNFIEQNQKTLIMLFDLYPNEDKGDIIISYYRFMVLKDALNLGFSIRKLRERIQGIEDAKYISDMEFDTVRAKLFNILDFMLYRLYISNPNNIKKIAAKLRESRTEEEKAAIYAKEAEYAWSAVSPAFKQHVLPAPRKGLSCKKIKNDFVDSLKLVLSDEQKLKFNSHLAKVVKNSDDFFVFTKILYAMTLFLDAGEIGFFISQLINKFSNIASLVDTLNEIKGDENYFAEEIPEEYKMFAESHRVVEELNVLKAVARMNKGAKAKKDQKAKIKRCHYMDAAAVLGCNDYKKVEKLFNLNETGRGADHSLRNFIINNVIYSRQFNYIVRFLNPRQARDIMKNKACVKFVLKDILDDQIIKYCERAEITFDAKNPDFDKMRAELANIIYKIQLEDFSGIKNKARQGSAEDRIKKQKISVLNLYLTVLYLFVKNLVNVNTYYTVAIGTLERDSKIMEDVFEGEQFYSTLNRGNENAIGITKKFVEERYVNKSVRKCYEDEKIGEDEYKLYSEKRFKLFRNAVAHLLVVSYLPKYIDNIHHIESYFDLYHTLIFFFIADRDKSLKEYMINDRLNLFEIVKNTNNAPRNFVHAITLPFAYCPARYINLSDKNKFELSFGK